MNEVELWLKELIRLQDADDNKTDKQVKILEAAVEIFSEKGYAAASTSEIAQKAGVAEGTIFRHYRTKKELLISIVAPIMIKLVAPFVIRELFPVLNQDFEQFEDFLRAMIKNRAEFMQKHVKVLKILIQEIPFHPELKEQFGDKVAKEVLNRIGQTIELQQAAGVLRPMPSMRAIRLLASSAFGYILMRYLLLPDHPWTKEEEEEEIEATIEYMMYGLRPRS